jgi:hypothetical protein
MEHREDWQGLPKYGGGRARQDSGSAPMLTCAASMAAYNVNMYVGFVCECVCILLPPTQLSRGPSAIVMKVLVIRRRAHIKEGGGQSGDDACKCVRRAATRKPLTWSKGVCQPWENRRFQTGYSLYMGLGDLFI